MQKMVRAFSEGWLKRSLESAENEVRSWPDGMRRQTLSASGRSVSPSSERTEQDGQSAKSGKSS